VTAQPLPPSSDPIGLLERLIRIETKLDSSHASDADHEARIRALESERHPDHEQRLNDHETRLRRAERSLWIAAGAAAAGGGILGSIVGPLIGQ
jgi:hypothetical protein